MLPPMQHSFVNWTDGMKITKSHFIQQENALQERMQDYARRSLTAYNYGLLPSVPGQDSSLRLQVTTEQVSLYACRAITMGGIRIEILQEHTPAPLTVTLQQIRQDSGKMNRELFVAVAVNPFARVPVGEPSPEETPMRHPFAIPEYCLEVIPVEDFNKDEWMTCHVPVGKVRIEAGLIQEVGDFIPPCTNMKSHAVLQAFHEDSKKVFPALLEDCVRIVHKIKTSRRNSLIAENLYYLSERLLAFLAESLDAYRYFLGEQAPLASVVYCMNIARLTRSVLHSLREREKLMSYFSQWSDFSPVEFENAMDALILLEYNHLNLFEAIRKASHVKALLASLFSKLSKLDYVEQRTDGIFI